jgi:REP element-mobilizing transposase RayT
LSVTVSIFCSKLGQLSTDLETPIYAWALMTNHAHILMRSGPGGLPAFMRKLLTGYAIAYNHRHCRNGHLFQNRYKSIVCEEDSYFLGWFGTAKKRPGKNIDSLSSRGLDWGTSRIWKVAD